ncbi:2-dehydro-3-deoxy-D-gluconate 5-dehydrogenase KduD [Deinococcus wulumuqiensis]|uniref:2-dehydro-3-deoxy-D-gluconate 5-dehydrogenase KduD n=1 Tax=Deinococcus wulumuqiensis TaxID=980427 RepID=UPI00242FE153|nr:2-dehydro-3-deoxy-D-gluconate 5-dehydrogenase KduD [Deinococcus wulumuqiensis]
MNSFDLTGQVALVTGGATGIGAGIALGLARAGANVALTTHQTDAGDILKKIEDTGRRGLVLPTDLSGSTPDSVAALLDEVEGELGPLDILVNNAGIIRREDAEHYRQDDWDAVIALNQTSVWLLCQGAGRRMLGRGHGKIINIASLLSFQGGIRVPAYAASKHAVAGLTQALANEWAGRGVNVNAIAPGYIETNNTAALRADAGRSAAILERIPAGRWGTPADLAGAAVFLASAASDYVHGQVLAVDGGWLAR